MWVAVRCSDSAHQWFPYRERNFEYSAVFSGSRLEIITILREALVHIVQERGQEARAAVHLQHQRLRMCIHCWQLHRERAVTLRACFEEVAARVRRCTLHNSYSSWWEYVRYQRCFFVTSRGLLRPLYLLCAGYIIVTSLSFRPASSEW